MPPPAALRAGRQERDQGQSGRGHLRDHFGL